MLSPDTGTMSERGQAPWLDDAIVWIARGIEAIGVATIAVSVVVALALVAVHRREGESYQLYRRHLGRGLLLGLEFLVAADVIRTVSHVPTLRSVVVLAIIVGIRTFLSVTIEVEIDGRWPWQRGRGDTKPS